MVVGSFSACCEMGPGISVLLGPLTVDTITWACGASSIERTPSFHRVTHEGKGLSIQSGLGLGCVSRQRTYCPEFFEAAQVSGHGPAADRPATIVEARS